jgi:hypothetical protein
MNGARRETSTSCAGLTATRQAANPQTANLTTLGTGLIFRVQSPTRRKFLRGILAVGFGQTVPTVTGGMHQAARLVMICKPHIEIVWLLRTRGSCPRIKVRSGQLLPLQVLI